jgi:tRNA-5-methyluridine54 2-sulfurtransferase
MKCRRCRDVAVIEVPRHNAGFCRECFVHHCQEQVKRAIREHDMFDHDARLLVAVSGGKDSLAIWDMLLDLGYRADGVYLGLGIGDYSDTSAGFARAYAAARGAVLREVDLPADVGFDIPTAALAIRRPPCAACGTSKRHLLNKVAVDDGYDVLVTGHNLDDEAAVLFGNVLHWSVEYLGRQLPVLPATDGFVRKAKPLVRLGERETAAYCVLRGIDYIIEECPNAAGNTHLGYKDALNAIESRSPGTKAAFYGGFLDRAAPRFRAGAADEAELNACAECGAPTPADVCAFCRLRHRAIAKLSPG